MKPQEQRCFERALNCSQEQLDCWDLLRSAPTAGQLQDADVVLFGGSGDYSVAQGGPWLEESLDAMRMLVSEGKPTFASCWGFQAMARALGGRVVTDLERAELGSVNVRLTPQGRADPVFGSLPGEFLTAMGHQDCVVELPTNAIRLAESNLVENQAFRIADKPIYCTQFHPELERAGLLERVSAYPQYVEKIAGVSIEEFAESCQETPEANGLLKRFVEQVIS